MKRIIFNHLKICKREFDDFFCIIGDITVKILYRRFSDSLNLPGQEEKIKTADPNQGSITVFTEFYFEISEFVKTFGPLFSAHLIGARRQRPFCRMSVCEIMTVLIVFQITGGHK